MKRRSIAAVILASLLLAAVPLTAFAQSDTGSAYSDISGKWFADAATKYGYTEVFSDGSREFNGDRDITRIEFVKLMHKALNININYFVAPDVKDYFDDVANTATGANELIDLATTGIIERDGSFNADKPLVREEMIHWIINALKYKTNGDYPIPMVKPVPFSDDRDISDAYRGEIYSSVVLKLVSGRGNNVLSPKDAATRAEAVTVISNLMTLIESYQSASHISASAQLAADGALIMSLTLRNDTDKVVTIHHTSGQKCDFKLFDSAGNNLYTWSADKMFAAIISETEIGPGETITFSDTLDREAYSAISPVESMRAYIIGTSEDILIDTNGYVATIIKE